MAKPGDLGQVLADHLVHQTSLTELEIGLVGAIGAHVADGCLRDLVAGNAADLLDVILSIEQLLIDPAAAAPEQAMALRCSICIPHGARHLFDSPQSP